MSFKIVEQAPARLNRSELAVPGSQPQLFEKAAKSAADVVFLDLEDAVAPDDKPQARKNVIQALDDIDWGTKTLSVRINGLDTHYMYRDVVDVLEQARRAARPDHDPQGRHRRRRLCRRHAGDPDRGRQRPQEAHRLRDDHRDRARHAQRRTRSPPPSKRNESLHFGVADYAASTRARTTNIGGANPDYAVLTDKADAGNARQPLGRHVALRHRPHGGGRARQWPAPGRRALRRFLRCRRLSRPRATGPAVLGCEGKWAIHPSQVALANEVFTPQRQGGGEGQAHSRRHGRRPQKEGKGAVALDGRLIDLASIRQAEVLVSKADQIGGAA